jgi:hypothetical protein
MLLPKLNFPEYKFKITATNSDGQSSKIFDIVRKKYVSLTPEEWVRQNLIHYLITEKKFPASLMAVEAKLKVNELFKRTDLVVYNNLMQPILIGECKSPSVRITQKAFDQAARYNLSLNVKYFILTNGLQIYPCKVNAIEKKYEFLEEIGEYSLIT